MPCLPPCLLAAGCPPGAAPQSPSQGRGASVCTGHPMCLLPCTNSPSPGHPAWPTAPPRAVAMQLKTRGGRGAGGRPVPGGPHVRLRSASLDEVGPGSGPGRFPREGLGQEDLRHTHRRGSRSHRSWWTTGGRPPRWPTRAQAQEGSPILRDLVLSLDRCHLYAHDREAGGRPQELGGLTSLPDFSLTDWAPWRQAPDECQPDPS